MTEYIIPSPEFLKQHILPAMTLKQKKEWIKKFEDLIEILREDADYKEEV